ncbi:hypothetical protein [Emcibacter sp.]|uniref:hypothetical protein n=1 Tax=Emcibacter sp. TaxID=1979954 RepID=UPI002AA8B18C|nr:hypothetical protein [Emcibacter sp.]
MIDFNNPYVLLGLLPFVLTMLAMALTRFYVGEGLGNTMASASLVGSFLLVLLIYFGWPTWPAEHHREVILYLCLFTLLYGLLLDRFPGLDSANIFFKSIIPLSGTFWVLAPGSDPLAFSEAEYRGLALIAVVAMGYFLKLEQDWQDGLDLTLPLLLVGLGGMAIAWTGGYDITRDILLAYSSALGGYMLLNMHKRRFPLGAAGLYPSFMIILTSLLSLIMDTPSLSPAIILLSGIFLADGISHRLPLSLPHKGKKAGVMVSLMVLSLIFAYMG